MVVNTIPISKDGFKCQRCGHEWVPKNKARLPTVCPGCGSPYWNRPRRQNPV